MKNKSLYINTIGCQMNVYESERIAAKLQSLGYETSSSVKTADLIIVNTCAIREKAQQKVFSFLGRLAELKRKKPKLVAGVCGCVAQQEGKKIFEKLPYIDFVVGTHAAGRLPEILERIESKKCRIVDIEMSDVIDESLSSAMPCDEKISRFVTIMQGCDNFCTYCVVPYVRGRETSRNPVNILKEIRELVDFGAKEITLLGQNVNSFGKKEGLCSFSELLTYVNDVKGLSRIRFTTSHPKDLSNDLIYAFKRLDKLCRHIHLPVQSGSDKILKKMNRKYTRRLYLERIDKLRNCCPDIAVTSDIIVGFPEETEADFKDTMDLIKIVRYDSLFAFKYSDRPNTPSAHYPNKISEEQKRDRLQELLALQKHYTNKKNIKLIGTNELVLIEGVSKKYAKANSDENCDIQWTGRTSTNKVVNFTCDNGALSDKIANGKIVNVKIEKALPNSLWGKVY